ncbi:uncharacterized protein LOC116770974 [Danaus plexippus]|uniref:uncharacterized protein LOC116770974 n=1 Tax=Danaus plexippus TaxID=13037 RepID=UPI002AB20A7F|nr:uncharacterized protein LOC116770974 [Danaus plexippus]XP_032518522.2 uncharacterized protein LOC116770974 [Danaus plexippus]
MKLFTCYITVALLAVVNAAVDVEKTVKQVQSILQANELLPRLTREEILQLLNDIREEDAKTKSQTKQSNVDKTNFQQTIKTAIHGSNEDNEINSTMKITSTDEIDSKQKSFTTTTSRLYTSAVESTTKTNTPTLTVVLPYTPRDGSSLQELYTRPPRLQIVDETTTPKLKPIKRTKYPNNKPKTTNKQKLDIPAELQAFLDAHGLKDKPGKDNFLLPLDGFKPLPPAKVVDGTVQLPENLLLTYDLISQSDKGTTLKKNQEFSQSNFLYEPLRPEIPFELDTASSNSEQITLPLDLPKPRKTKAVSESQKPNYQPIDYDSVKVIPLNKGPEPEEDEVILDSEQNKRQTNDSSNLENITTTEVSIPENGAKDASATASDVVSDSDTGASITDLEDSFGGPAPSKPGDADLPPPKKNGFYWMLDWNSFLEVGDGDTKVNIRFEPKLGDPQMFLPVNVP